MDGADNGAHKEIQELFLNSQSILLLNHDPEKKNFKSNLTMTAEDLELRKNACIDEASNLMTSYLSLEEHVTRFENPDSSSGSDNRDLATRVRTARSSFCSRVNNVIRKLNQHLIALNNTISDTRHGNEVIIGRSWDLKDSAERSIEKLQRQLRHWEKRIFKAGISLSPIKNTVKDMGRKNTQNRKKNGTDPTHTDQVATGSGQPDKTGKSGDKTQYKIKLKRLHPQTIQGNPRPPQLTTDLNPTDVDPHERQFKPPDMYSAMETMPSDSPSVSSESQNTSGTQDTQNDTRGPDSTSDIQTSDILPFNSGEINDTQMDGQETENQM